MLPLLLVAAFAIGIGLAHPSNEIPSDAINADSTQQSTVIAQSDPQPEILSGTTGAGVSAAPEDPVSPRKTRKVELYGQNANAAYNRLHIGTAFKYDPKTMPAVLQAAQYLLAPTGYRLVIPYDSARQVNTILMRPVSPLGQTSGYVHIEDALLLIAGDDVALVVDHANKLVSYQLLSPS